MGSLIGVGGLIVNADNLAATEKSLETLCTADFSFPEGEVFKWSPAKTDWYRNNIVGVQRKDFIERVFEILAMNDAKAVVAICDETKGKANTSSSSHEMDVLLLSLERFHTSLGDETGFVFVAKPSGGTKDENKFLAECIEHKSVGTDFVKFTKIAHNIVSVPTAHSRVLQAADLIISISTAMASGNTTYAGDHFSKLKPLFLTDRRGLIGGTGFKLHPSYSYKNLYHWVLEEEFWADGSSGFPFPDASRPYSADGDKF
ncbi:hypothetical protein JQW92_01860 [Sulfitobacter pseudonitzschiae]|nr:hypothetical protein [Pseudosulfitobacter pseudonitzschiae]MBM1813797.1 hypothetical protein [Pseudosulfitobacter pseudonitzschiae]MBM1830790.1 hypothetical protein [Pseudosulfitobacter pseudonitzschiae]MBM1835657.1 hypothetical protein [Pseudosulfitobacter pseudonitzschiae]MBM1840503.1 hypothetical protein [Pseudosulfitobacter pseudonitzschiae]MBM1845509.1 hypothetical protein [Pseudosulfitobacter pseudonitzschiae]